MPIASLRQCALILALSFTAFAARAAEPVTVTTPRGAAIAVLAEKPAGSGPFPAVVLGSGSGYHMRLPLQEQVARALLAKGIAVYRFDWGYQVAGTAFAAQPKDRRAEIEDMTTVLGLARRDTAIDSARIAVAGKSLGSIIAWRVLRAEPALKGALLLTPVCARPGEPDAGIANYPALAAEQRPLAWLLGDADPACPATTLYRLLAPVDHPGRIAVIGGDHGFEDKADTANDAARIALAAEIAAQFAAALLADRTGQ